ncbi:8383_t:CDS:2 [Entrophospora sp. SA101]|nr:1822_t:CDS:2 [Entrophospora sp. SA101]CAJ0758245.1 8383_t:CDS:2 [Entrophospora sp. SA101]CAJ0829837.1 12711_t:CDS:2 [Entrophospora sp. SA101]CAJ0830566.1 2937_t:CDS:2 [Entrophospora sp. SA101]
MSIKKYLRNSPNFLDISYKKITKKFTFCTHASSSSLPTFTPNQKNRFNIPRLTSYDTLNYKEPPKSCTMLVRDFIDDSLYNPNYGYFSKNVAIFSTSDDNVVKFNEIKDNLEFLNVVGKQYQEFENNLEKEDKQFLRQIRHTPTELFKPWYGYSIAKYIATEYNLNPQNDLIIYELGAGNGTLMLNILDYLQKFEPAIYKKTKYRVVEISHRLAAEMQKSKNNKNQRVGFLGSSGGRDAAAKTLNNHHDCIEIINKNIFDWCEVVNENCFFLACEVLDNFAHDVIRYDAINEKPLQGVVIIDNEGDFEEVYEPINDPLISKLLSIRNQTSYKSPVLQNRLLRKLRNKLPLAYNMTQSEFIPTKLLQFLIVLKHYFPKHRLIITDFYKLTNSILQQDGGGIGDNAPAVQTRFQQTMIPCSTYLVKPGYFDIIFPINFELLKDLYQLMFFSSKSSLDEKVKILTHKNFMERYADLNKTKTSSGENPLLLYYENVKFLLT